MTAGVAIVWSSAAFLAVFLAWFAWSFNRLVRDRNLVTEGWSGIDVQLKRRHDLVPSLVETVRGYAEFEKGLLEDVTRLRAGASGREATRELRNDENALTDRLRTLFAVAEAYPDLKANRSFLTLQQQLTEIEDALQYARRYYNGTVRNFNIRVESFPSNLVARLFGFSQAEFFEIQTATERQTPSVDV